MNELDAFEAELRGVRPAAPPPELLTRLQTIVATPRFGSPVEFQAPNQQAGVEKPALAAPQRSREARALGPLLLRWFIPAAAVLVLVAGVTRVLVSPAKPSNLHASVPLEARDVYLDRRFVGAFDALARLPEGELLRVHCQEWVDELMWRDKSGTVTFKELTPRLEVVPIRFETD